uniref:Uncharacterized phage-associated protein n=1 Tax=Candidatus Kentrum sp. MB TaxID=2138164 RepID=A0A450X8X8_9GAMM|nr:MAG: Uncharacterized phage-associated protein [Candidatus Kentron sp. MB]VFK29735.1 MAG: Uncharacterized phage-associated protein [Candidatus Kentron sp. MB]VFK74889.1 MAG: Uncharacterized phage-associated protein [Candidatus Kentron sp. MB]
MIKAKDVANYFLAMADEDSDLSNMKIQKLIYYAQAFHLAIFDKPLFDEDIKAWMHGPVIPLLYQEYKKYGSAPIVYEGENPSDPFSEQQIDLLNEVNEVFEQFSAGRLRNMTHEDAPWIEMEKTAGVIEKERMMEFYKTRLK